MRILLDPLGIKVISEEYVVRFGNKHYTKINDDLHAQGADECILRQVHGTDCVEASSQKILTADAQWTCDEKNLCIIKTADCLPIFIFSPVQRKLLSIHAGWRGLVGGIIEKSIQQEMNQDQSRLQVFIGPHLGKESFEVDQDVYDQIARWLDEKNLKNWFVQRGVKYFINLEALVFFQLDSLGIAQSNIRSFPIDTKTGLNWNSYRRSSGDPARNLSWGCLLTKAK